MEYELYDREKPNITLTKLEEQIKRKKEKAENPEVKPKDVFVGFVETRTGKGAARKRKKKSKYHF
tara:strand:+ start:121 stop:315 length:195 start_codon:yes stop_codon:yes gene_type:complete